MSSLGQAPEYHRKRMKMCRRRAVMNIDKGNYREIHKPSKKQHLFCVASDKYRRATVLTQKTIIFLPGIVDSRMAVDGYGV